MIKRFSRKKNKIKGKVGLALGSGSARGWAHIGVIRALAEYGIEVDYIAGTSIGALVGAVHAAGQIEIFEKVVLEMDWKQVAMFFDVVLPKSGLLDGKKISAFVRNHVKNLTIQELGIPFCAVATNLDNGSQVVLDKGDIIEAVRASISVPGVFTPARYNGMTLVDGGLVDPVPVKVCRDMGADYVIAVDLNHSLLARNQEEAEKAALQRRKEHDDNNGLLEFLNRTINFCEIPAIVQIRQWANREPLPNIFEVLIGSINIMEAQVTQMRLTANPPDLLIQPELGDVTFLEFNRAKETITQGYKTAKAQLDSVFG